MKISNEFKIGFWTVIAILVLVFGIQYLKGINSLHLGQFFYIQCSDVEGLANSSPVKINGFQVGLVRSMEYDHKGSGKIIVELNIEDTDLKIPSDSRAFVQADLLGTSSVIIELGSSNEFLANRETIPGGDKMPGLLDAAQPIIPAITELVPKIDSLIAGVNVLVNESKMQESLLEINKLSEKLNVTVATLNKMLKGDVPEILANVNGATSNLNEITEKVNNVAIDSLLLNASTTLENANALLSTLTTTQGSAGKIINSAELHDQIVETIGSVEALVDDIKENPKRYISIKLFGRNK